MIVSDSSQSTVVHSVPGAWLPQTETWLHNQLRFLPAWIESHVVCERVENLDQFEVPNLHCRHRGDLAERRLRFRRHDGFLLWQAAAVGAGLVHSHFGPQGWRDSPVARRLGIRHVVSFYGYDVSHLPHVSAKWRWRYRHLFRRVDTVLAEGEHMAGRLADLGCPQSKLRVHRLGVDLSAIEYRPRVWDRREPLRVLLAASFRPKKGLPAAIEALGRLRREVKVQVTIIGDATAAPGSHDEKRRILTAIERHGLDADLLGFRTHDVLLEQAARHHLYLAPSVEAADGDTEGGAPITLIEMIASGMPVVSSRHCDIPGVVRHGRSGYLAREGDVGDLLQQLRRTLAFADRWPAMLRAGRTWVEQRFDAAVQGKRLASIYLELTTGLRRDDLDQQRRAA